MLRRSDFQEPTFCFLDSPLTAVEDASEFAIVVIGIPGATPYHLGGPYCAGAPKALREASRSLVVSQNHYDFDLGGQIMPPSWSLQDCGDLYFDADDFCANRLRIEKVYTALLSRNAKPLLLGGDDSVQIPALKAFAARGDITILQIDAHIDWRDEVQGERFGLSSTMRRARELDGVKSMVQVGARGIGSARPSDVDDALATGACIVDMRQIRSKGIGYAAAQVPAGRDVVVCLDVDGLDPSVVPGVIGRAPGGLTYGDVVELLHGVASKARIVGFNIVEFVPENDVGSIGARAVCRLAMLGAGLMARSG